MTKLSLLLLAALIASSLWLVRVSYESRRLYTALDRARAEERALEIERERLKTGLRALATPLHLERTAREKLAMRTATPAVTHYASLSASSPTSLPPQPPAPPTTFAARTSRPPR